MLAPFRESVDADDSRTYMVAQHMGALACNKSSRSCGVTSVVLEYASQLVALLKCETGLMTLTSGTVLCSTDTASLLKAFADDIRTLASQEGCDVIVDDIGYFE